MKENDCNWSRWRYAWTVLLHLRSWLVRAFINVFEIFIIIKLFNNDDNNNITEDIKKSTRLDRMYNFTGFRDMLKFFKNIFQSASDITFRVTYEF